MSQFSKYTVTSALEVLSELHITPDRDRVIAVKSGTLGLHKLGALDFLVNYHHYWVRWTRAS